MNKQDIYNMNKQDIYKYLKADRLQLSTNGYVNRIGFAWDYSKIIE